MFTNNIIHFVPTNNSVSVVTVCGTRPYISIILALFVEGNNLQLVEEKCNDYMVEFMTFYYPVTSILSNLLKFSLLR